MALSQWRNFSPAQKLPASWTDGVEKALSNYASPNFAIDQSSDTVLRVKAGTADLARVIAVNGAPRWNEADASATHPGGGAGSFDLWATANANAFSTDAGPPPFEVDGTTYSFGLKIGTPSGSGAEALSRKIATGQWDGSKILYWQSLVRGDQSKEPWVPILQAGITWPAASGSGARWTDGLNGAGVAGGGNWTATAPPPAMWRYTTDDNPPGRVAEYRWAVRSLFNTSPNQTWLFGVARIATGLTVNTSAQIVTPSLSSYDLSTSTLSYANTSGLVGALETAPSLGPGLTNNAVYAIGATPGGSPAANSFAYFDVQLQRRWV